MIVAFREEMRKIANHDAEAFQKMEPSIGKVTMLPRIIWELQKYVLLHNLQVKVSHSF